MVVCSTGIGGRQDITVSKTARLPLNGLPRLADDLSGDGKAFHVSLQRLVKNSPAGKPAVTVASGFLGGDAKTFGTLADHSFEMW
jgi:hypothetical protein